MNELDMTVLAVRCGKTKHDFGMSLKEIRQGEWYAYWTFPLTDEAVRVETNDRKDVRGFYMSVHYPGCPHCGSMGYYSCEKCGQYVCWDEEQKNLSCPWCGSIQSGQQKTAIHYSNPSPEQAHIKTQPQPIIHVSRIPQPLAPGVLDLGDGVTMEFIHIPAGEFRMGRDWTFPELPEAKKKLFIEKSGVYPEHIVHLDEYWIAKYPVTNRQYYQYVRKGGGRPPGYKLRPSLPQSKEDFPVDEVNWEMAVGFCAWVAGLTGKKVSLPTEAQWEKAARGTDARLFPWGNQEPTEKLANYGKNFNDGSKALTRVGKYPAGASPYGVLDMAGNVYQWVLDWYGVDYYKTSPSSNPTGPAAGQWRVMRGSSYYLTGYLLSSYSRQLSLPTSIQKGNGFRCVTVP